MQIFRGGMVLNMKIIPILMQQIFVIYAMLTTRAEMREVEKKKNYIGRSNTPCEWICSKTVYTKLLCVEISGVKIKKKQQPIIVRTIVDNLSNLLHSELLQTQTHAYPVHNQFIIFIDLFWR